MTNALQGARVGDPSREIGYVRPVPKYECELVLRENDHETRFPHSFFSQVRPGTYVRMDDRDWIIIEIEEGDRPSVICRPASVY